MPKISIIIPIYNVENFIEKCAISLFEQSLQDIEYIFIDDCSPDNSVQILKKIIKLYPNRNVKIITHDYNKGLAAARKTGIFAATGKYIAHCDSDDWVEPNMYEKLIETAEVNNADIVASSFFLENAVCTSVIRYPYNHEFTDDILNPDYFGWIYGAVWNKLIKKDLYFANEIFPIEGINMWEDTVITLRLRLASKKTLIINEPYYHYWVGKRQSTFFSINDIRKVDEMIAATNFIEHFLNKNNLGKESFLYVSKMKLLAKERLLNTPSWKHLKKWKEIFPDNDLNVWKFKQYSLTTKLKITILHCLPKYLAYPFFLLKKHG